MTQVTLRHSANKQLENAVPYARTGGGAITSACPVSQLLLHGLAAGSLTSVWSCDAGFFQPPHRVAQIDELRCFLARLTSVPIVAVHVELCVCELAGGVEDLTAAELKYVGVCNRRRL